MNQQVNLYLPIFRKQEKIFSALTMVQALGAVLVFLGMLSAYGSWNTGQVEEKLLFLKNQEQSLQAQLVEMRSRGPAKENKKLETERLTLQKEIERREKVSVLIAQQNLGNSAGFSDYMEGLARRHVSGLALNQFQFHCGGCYIELGGWTRTASRVPKYLTALQQDTTFTDTRFGVVVIERDKDRRDALKFSVAEPAGDAEQ